MDNGEQPSAELPRFSKGKRPQFSPVEGHDELMSMILALASEVSTMRDRMETMEILAGEQNIFSSDAVDNFKPDAALLNQREERRQAFLERLYYLTLKKAHEQVGDETEEKYLGTISEIAKG